MFYGIIAAIDGCAEMKGVPVPTNHNARRSLVERHLPYLLDLYNDLYGQSLIARYGDGYTMTENEGLRAARCHEVLSRSIPVQWGIAATIVCPPAGAPRMEIET